MNATVNENCIGCGLCAGTCPVVFSMGDDGLAHGGEVPDNQLNQAQDARDAYLHDAEAILLEDAPVIPVCCQGGSFRLAEGLSGLYRAPDGVYFLYYLEG